MVRVEDGGGRDVMAETVFKARVCVCVCEDLTTSGDRPSLHLFHLSGLV